MGSGVLAKCFAPRATYCDAESQLPYERRMTLQAKCGADCSRRNLKKSQAEEAGPTLANRATVLALHELVAGRIDCRLEGRIAGRLRRRHATVRGGSGDVLHRNVGRDADAREGMTVRRVELR